jgi:hypothetical protein
MKHRIELDLVLFENNSPWDLHLIGCFKHLLNTSNRIKRLYNVLSLTKM